MDKNLIPDCGGYGKKVEFISMNNKDKSKVKCRCPLGRYFHSSSELCVFRYKKDLDGMGTIEEWYNFCPYCGKDLSEDKKRLWGINKG